MAYRNVLKCIWVFPEQHWRKGSQRLNSGVPMTAKRLRSTLQNLSIFIHLFLFSYVKNAQWEKELGYPSGQRRTKWNIQHCGKQMFSARQKRVWLQCRKRLGGDHQINQEAAADTAPREVATVGCNSSSPGSFVMGTKRPDPGGRYKIFFPLHC